MVKTIATQPEFDRLVSKEYLPQLRDHHIPDYLLRFWEGDPEDEKGPVKDYSRDIGPPAYTL